MELTKDDLKYISDWETKRKGVFIRVLILPIIYGITTYLTTVFDSRFEYHPESLNFKTLISQVLTFAIIWGIGSGIFYYLKEKKYKKLLENKEA